MAEYPAVCRVCLAINVNLLKIADTPLEYVYKRLTNINLHNTDMKPLTACRMCCALLRKSFKLMLTSLTSESLLTDIVKRNSKVTKRSVSLLDRKAHKLDGSLVISPPECIDCIPYRPVTENHAEPPHLPPGENARPTPETAVEIKEEPDIKVEYDMEDIEAAPPPPTMEVPAIDEDIAIEKKGSVSDVQHQAPILIKVNVNGLRTSKDQPLETHVPIIKPVSQPTKLRQPGLRTSKDQPLETHVPIIKPVSQPTKLRQPGVKTFTCTVCQHQFKYKNVYENHLRTHTGEKPFACHLCERKFSVSANLEKHLKTHTSDKPYECPLCNTSFKLFDHLKRHAQTHTGEKPFQCLVCHRRFTRKYHLNSHSLVHSGEKLFECNVCQSRYVNNSGLKRHMKMHTGKKYTCDVCKSEFGEKSTLRIHLIINNGDEVLKCKKCKKMFHYRSRKRHSKMCKRCCLKRKKKLKKLND